LANAQNTVIIAIIHELPAVANSYVPELKIIPCSAQRWSHRLCTVSAK